MLRWRTLAFVLLLVLSLPVLPGAQAATLCRVAPAVTGTVSEDAARGVTTPHADAGQHRAAITADRPCEHGGSNPATRHTHAAGLCGVCSACYSAGAAAPASIARPPSSNVAAVAFRPVSDAATCFLTGGIERPPRLPLA